MNTKFTNPTSKLLKTTASLSILMGLVCAQTASAASYPVLKIENFIGTVDVQTGQYDKITVTDADGTPVERSGDDVLIDAGYTIDNANCKSTNSNVKISIGKWKYNKRSGGYKDLKEYPKLIITAPVDTHVNIKKSVIFGDIDTIGSAHIRLNSCGDLDLEDVTGTLDIGIRGSGDILVGNAGATEISLAGSGSLTMQNLASASISIAGSGDVEIGNVIGHVTVKSRGSGDVEMGQIGGDFEYDSAGSGDFEAESVDGNTLSISTRGSGDVEIDEGNVETLYIETMGSGNVEFDGNSVDASAKTRGSGDINIRRPSGDLEMSERGSGDVHVSR